MEHWYRLLNRYLGEDRLVLENQGVHILNITGANSKQNSICIAVHFASLHIIIKSLYKQYCSYYMDSM